VLLVLGWLPQLVDACVVTYTDSSVDANQKTVSAWSFAEDYFDEGSCFQAAYYEWYLWAHNYEAQVHISSPTQNWVTDSDDQQGVTYGGGSAYAFASISYDGDPGDYEICWWIWLWCSVVEYFVDEFLMGQINAGGPGPMCSGTPAAMAAEYQSGAVYPTGPTPALQCSDFVAWPRAIKMTADFTWDDLNGKFDDGNPHHFFYGALGWGHIKPVALAKLQGTRNSYGYGIRLTSGYRCPEGHLDVNGGNQNIFPNSYHMQGQAFDMYRLGYSKQNQWSEMQHDVLKTHAVAQGTISTSIWTTYPTDRHLHVTYSLTL
jgi:hypothetical protein